MSTKPGGDGVAIVTGAGKGIGRAVARMLATTGAAVVACARTGRDLDGLARDIAAAGGRCATFAGDVGEAATADALVRTALDRFGACDLLVNAAGVQPVPALVEDLALEDWQRTFGANMTGTFLTCRAVVPHMKRRRRGRIVNLSSGLATRAQPGQTAYSASKAAVLHFSTVLAEEVAPFGISVNSAHPGIVRTGMVETILAAQRSGVAATMAERIEELDKAGALISPETSARFICWLAASEVRNGAFVRIDDPGVAEAVAQFWSVSQ
jgi:3-oxoacyl-[acyl-carrier protein] reductase